MDGLGQEFGFKYFGNWGVMGNIDIEVGDRDNCFMD